MKVICSVENVKNAVLTAERFSGRHITLPILSHLLLRATEKKVVILGTNLEMGIEYSLPGKVQKPGAVTAPARQLSQLVQSLTDEVANIESDSHQLSIHTPSSDSTLNGLNPEDFPKLPTIKTEHSFLLPAHILHGALAQVLPSVAVSSLKVELSGVFLAARDGALTLAATDSFRLAEKTITHLENIHATVECIVPARTLQEVLHTTPTDADLEIRIGEHQIVFAWGESRIISRLVDGTYPPYQKIIPKAYETTLAVSGEDLLKRIRLASVFSTRLNDVTISFSPTEIEVATANSESGGSRSRLQVKGRGKSGSAMFNYRYLTDGIEAAGGGQMVMHMNGSSGPTLIQNPTDTSFTYLVMPIRSV